MTLGEKISALRKQRAMSQEDLALQLNVTRQAVSKWEQDENAPDMDKIVGLSNIFGVTTDYLLKDENLEGNKSKSDTETIRVGGAFIGFDTYDGDIHVLRHKKSRSRNILISNIYNIAAVAYIIMGFVWGLWHPGWLIFVMAWVIQDYKNFYRDIYNVALVIFLVLGFLYGLWVYAWLAFPVAWLIKHLLRDYRRNRFDD